MREMHYFKKTRQEEITSPEFEDDLTAKYLLLFLSDLHEWTHSTPCIYRDVEKNSNTIYVLYRDFAFTDQDFWQNYGEFIVILYQRWHIDVYGTELDTQETVELSLDYKNEKCYAIQKTVSGQYADSIISMCLRIECLSSDEMEKLYLLCQAMTWQSGILVADWDLRDLFEKESITFFKQKNSYYCYGYLSDSKAERENLLDVLNLSQKMRLWEGFLDDGFDVIEFEWLYNRILNKTLENRIEWELSLYSVLKKLGYTFVISESEFEMYDGSGKRCYFNFNSSQSSQRALLKMFFPINIQKY